MLKQIILLSLCGYIALSNAERITSKLVKCHVCKVLVKEFESEVSKIDPAKKVDVGGFRFDSDSKTVPMVKSELFLTEVMERICDKLEDYVKVTYKKSGKFAVIPLMVGKSMNPDAGLVDFIQDGDLNKSLGHFCLEILDDHDEAFLKSFQAPTLSDDLDTKICSELTNYCDYYPPQEDYEFVGSDEL